MSVTVSDIRRSADFSPQQAPSPKRGLQSAASAKVRQALGGLLPFFQGRTLLRTKVRAPSAVADPAPVRN